jgi:leucyl aminopeptidase
MKKDMGGAALVLGLAHAIMKVSWCFQLSLARIAGGIAMIVKNWKNLWGHCNGYRF